MDLKELMTINDAAVATFEELKNRQRYRKETNLRRFRRTLIEKYGKIDHEQLEDVFKRMESLGMGSLVIGRDDKPTRFVWKYSLREVAKAAEAGRMPKKEIPNFRIPKPLPKVGVTKETVSNGMKPMGNLPFKKEIPGEAGSAKIDIFLLDDGRLKRYRVGGANLVVLKSILDDLVREEK